MRLYSLKGGADLSNGGCADPLLKARRGNWTLKFRRWRENRSGAPAWPCLRRTVRKLPLNERGVFGEGAQAAAQYALRPGDQYAVIGKGHARAFGLGRAAANLALV